MRFEAVPVGLVRPLRTEVLRADEEGELAAFPGDGAAQALHLAALTGPGSDAGSGGEVVGVVSVCPESSPWAEARLRGMAVAEAWRGRGVGRQLLTAVENALTDRGDPAVWCKARLPAVGFYERLGWRCVTEAYDVPRHGPHRSMVKALASTPSGG